MYTNKKHIRKKTIKIKIKSWKHTFLNCKGCWFVGCNNTRLKYWCQN
jgi:hypothetical protein